LRNDVRLSVRDFSPTGGIAGTEYRAGDRWDSFTVKTDSAAIASFCGEILTLNVFSSGSAPDTALPPNALIGKISAASGGGLVVYTLTPAADIDGYYIETADDGIRLNIKRRPSVKTGNRPLSGITVVIDAGHGGGDTGAFGPLGTEFAEKHINLYAALKLRYVLRGMGARVALTRSSDADTSLQSRLDLSRILRPDLFISLHCNSMDYDVNSDSIRGVVVLFREEAARDFSERIYDHLQWTLDIAGRGVRPANLYVCRGTWAPHTLIEMGFINNPFDYERLIDNEELDKMARAIADGVLRYFT